MIKIFTRFEFFLLNKPYVSTKSRRNTQKSQQITHYFPIQKSLKMLPNISSTSTFPTIMPRCFVAKRKSSAALSKSFFPFYFKKFFRCFIHCAKCCLCLSLVIRTSSSVISLFFKQSFIFETNLLIFKFSLSEINT